MSNNQVSVNFRVTGNDLSNYIDSIKKKSQDLTNDAIKGALAQSEAGRNQIKIINEQITAIERKARIESQAARSIALDQRETALKSNSDTHDARKNQIFSNTQLSELDKKERITALTGSETAESQRIKNEYRDNLTVLKEQEKQSKMQTILSREQIDTLKLTADRNIRAIMTGDKKLEDVISSASTDEEKLVAKLTEDGLNKEKKNGSNDERKNGVFGELLAVDNLNKVISTAGQFAQTKNGFDLLQSSGSVIGEAAGAVIGGALAGLFTDGVGILTGAAVGGEIGSALGGGVGALQQREAISKESFRKSALRYQAITGSSVDSSAIPDMSESGIDYTQYMGIRSEYARRRASASNSDKTTRDAIYLEKGYGIDQGTSASVVEIQRSARENNRDLANLIGGIIEKGQGSIFQNSDNTFLNEFVGKFTLLQKELLKTSTTVSTGITMDILKQFNAFGGMFDARDPRSSGIITSIQGSLSNPTTDNLKALEFGVLRNQYPNKGIFDLREEMQKGLGSPTLLKGMLDQVDRIGGGDQSEMNNLSGMLPGIPLAAIRTLFLNRKSLINFDTKELKGIGLTDDVLRSQSDASTTDLEKNTAKVENGILSGEAIEAMKDAFETAVVSSLSGAVIELKNGQGTIKLGTAITPIKSNTTTKPKYPDALVNQWMGK